MRFVPQYKLLGHKGAIYKLIDISADGFISLGGDGYVVQWQKSSRPHDGLLLAKDTGPIYTGCFIENDDVLYIGKLDGTISKINIRDKEVATTYKAHSKSVYGLIDYQDYILSVGGDGCLVFYNKIAGRVEESIQLTNAACRSLKVINNEIVVTSSDGNIYIITNEDRSITQHKVADLSLFCQVNFDNRLLLGGRDCKVYEMSLPDKLISKVVDAHMATINDIISMKDLILTACRDKSIRVWSSDLDLIQSLTPILGGHVNSVNGLLPCDDASSFYSCSDDKSIILWTID